MLRSVYTALLYVFAPIAWVVTALRGVRDPAYRDRLPERLGFTRVAASPLWIHAVSVGEVQAAAVLVRALLKKYPDQALLITTATPTGAQRVKALFGESVRHAYLPYDLPGAALRFLNRVRPSIAIVMEREIWPNLFRECARRGIPLLLASARISERSAVRHQRFASLFGEALANVIVAAQTEQDADRYRAIGARTVHTTGNVKFDIEPPLTAREQGHELRTSQLGQRLVWVAGSTHEGEEEQVLAAHLQMMKHRPDALLILVPRHPNRFDSVRAWLKTKPVMFVSRSRRETVTDASSVLLADTLGELMTFYAAADIAFVGGSLIATVGGHNLLDPAVLERPVLTGPHNFNAPDIAQLMLESSAARQVNSADELATALLELGADASLRKQMGTKGSAIVAANRGALGKVLMLVESLRQASSNNT